MKKLLFIASVFSTAALSSVFATGVAAQEKNVGEKGLTSITVLPPDVSARLDIFTIPTREPTPIVIGTFWDCKINAQDFEVCDFKIVVCTDDRRFCATVP